MKFFGHDLELNIENVLTTADAPGLFTARDDEGVAWLIAQVASEPTYLACLCAPMSEQAAQAVVNRSADPRDAIRHSLTGTVELVTINDGRPNRDSCLLCAELPQALLASVSAPGRLPLAG